MCLFIFQIISYNYVSANYSQRYLGCFVDSDTSRDLEHFVSTLDSNTLVTSDCLGQCRTGGFEYAGMLYMYILLSWGLLIAQQWYFTYMLSMCDHNAWH